MQAPLLILSDSPDVMSGLARISRDIATVACSMPEFRVGILGRGGHGTRKMPCAQYCFPETRGFGEYDIQHAWHDFAGDAQGIVLCVWDATRVDWLSRPRAELGDLGKWLMRRPFQLAIYAPVDATGPNDRLTSIAADSMRGFDHVLAYTSWGAGVIQRSIGREVDWMPHGYNGDTFQPRGRTAARIAMGFDAGDTVIGMVATNQARKDWGTAIAAISALRNRNPRIRFWMHTDVMTRSHAWDMNALIEDYGIGDILKLTMTGDLNDEALSYFYSACDLTILPSAEGFGYPIVESLACGTPCLHGEYGGGSELLPAALKVPPYTYRLEGIHNNVRPVYRPEDWVEFISYALKFEREKCPDLVKHLNWEVLSVQWKKALRKLLAWDGLHANGSMPSPAK